MVRRVRAEQDVFAAYADGSPSGSVAGRRAGAVWSSWYSYYEDITEDRIARAAADLEGTRSTSSRWTTGGEPIVGDWTAGPDFPSGMAATARTIARHGFRPGIWLAPLIALPGSTIATERPDLLVAGDDGRPLVTGHNWGSHYHSLDTTNPEVTDHLRGVFDGSPRTATAT